MIEQKRGVIVNLASMAGKIGSRANLPYNASKAAVISMTKSLALAYAADGIRVNCVCPGFVATDMWTSLVQELGPLFKQSPEEFAPQSPPDPVGAYGAAGRRRQRDRVPRVSAVRVHDRPGPQRRRRTGRLGLGRISAGEGGLSKDERRRGMVRGARSKRAA
jgi:NAD(P)-dependent dehydrogenase (short-subunit alcohol dehydrogenase family)